VATQAAFLFVYAAARSKNVDDIGKTIRKPAQPGHDQPFHRADR
jgi:hypothetical protein